MDKLPTTADSLKVRKSGEIKCQIQGTNEYTGFFFKAYYRSFTAEQKIQKVKMGSQLSNVHIVKIKKTPKRKKQKSKPKFRVVNILMLLFDFFFCWCCLVFQTFRLTLNRTVIIVQRDGDTFFFFKEPQTTRATRKKKIRWFSVSCFAGSLSGEPRYTLNPSPFLSPPVVSVKCMVDCYEKSYRQTCTC